MLFRSSGVTYSQDGPLEPDSTDQAVKFDTTTDYADGGDVHDVGSADDLAVFMVVRIDDTASGAIVSKMGIGGVYWYMDTAGSGTEISCQVRDGTTSYTNTITGLVVGQWHVVGMVLDRSVDKLQVGQVAVIGSAAVATALSTTGCGQLLNSDAFRLGYHTSGIGNVDAAPVTFAGAYIATGSGAASGMSANLAAALEGLRDQLVDAVPPTFKNLLLMGCG